MKIKAIVHFNQGLIPNIRAKTAQGLASMLMEVDRRSVSYAPVKTGALRRSGRPVLNANNLSATMTFGNDKVKYANVRHKWNKTGRIGYLAIAGEEEARGNLARHFRY